MSYGYELTFVRRRSGRRHRVDILTCWRASLLHDLCTDAQRCRARSQRIALYLAEMASCIIPRGDASVLPDSRYRSVRNDRPT